MKFRDFIAIVRSGDLEAVEAAIETHPDLLHTHDPEGSHEQERTAMHCAARHGHLEIIKFLVSQGAQVYSDPTCTYPPIFFAANNLNHADHPDTQDVVDYFLNEIPQKADGTGGLGIAINLAARFGWTDIVRKHLERDPLAVHQRGWIGDTPLHWSSHNGHVEIVEMLIDTNADLEADEINCYGGKPLHWASECHPEVVKLLLERGANVNSTNDNRLSKYFRITPLGMNVLMQDDCAEVTQILLSAGANAAFEFNGKNLETIAIENKNHKILEVLRSHS